MLRDRLSAYSGTFAARVVTGRAFIDFCSRGLCTVAYCEPVAAMRRCADPRGCAKRLSVSKMPHAGKHHRNLMFIRGGNDFIVANRPSRLNHTARACGRNNIQAIPEREKASDATAKPVSFEPVYCALPPAIRAASRRLI